MKSLSKRLQMNWLMSLLLVMLIPLSSCNVRPSFGYAFWGTCGVMLVALVIATVVTQRAKRNGREE